MGRRKTVLKVPNQVRINCPNCHKVSQLEFPEDESPVYFECPKCEQKSQAPISQCCIICAFSNKKCIRYLKTQALTKGLELKRTPNKEKALVPTSQAQSEARKLFGL